MPFMCTHIKFTCKTTRDRYRPSTRGCRKKSAADRHSTLRSAAYARASASASRHASGKVQMWPLWLRQPKATPLLVRKPANYVMINMCLIPRAFREMSRVRMRAASYNLAHAKSCIGGMCCHHSFCACLYHGYFFTHNPTAPSGQSIAMYQISYMQEPLLRDMKFTLSNLHNGGM